MAANCGFIYLLSCAGWLKFSLFFAVAISAPLPARRLAEDANEFL
jgi:hypothetical protein